MDTIRLQGLGLKKRRHIVQGGAHHLAILQPPGGDARGKGLLWVDDHVTQGSTIRAKQGGKDCRHTGVALDAGMGSPWAWASSDQSGKPTPLWGPIPTSGPGK